MAARHHPRRGQRPQLHLLPEHHRLHRGRIRHLRRARSSSARSNGGVTWTTQSAPPGTGVLTGVSCPTASICIAVSDFDTSAPSIIATTDGGASWVVARLPEHDHRLQRGLVRRRQHCTAVGASSVGPGVAIVATTNGGSTWTPQAVPTGVSTLNAVSCTTIRRALPSDRTSSGPQTVAHSGPTWATQPVRTALSGISCISPTTCTAVGAATILVTGDAGASWTSQAAPAGVGLSRGVSCASPANCEAVGSGSDFGGTIETLSAPPTVTTTRACPRAPSACPTRGR